MRILSMASNSSDMGVVGSAYSPVLTPAEPKEMHIENSLPKLPSSILMGSGNELLFGQGNMDDMEELEEMLEAVDDDENDDAALYSQGTSAANEPSDNEQGDTAL